MWSSKNREEQEWDGTLKTKNLQSNLIIANNVGIGTTTPSNKLSILTVGGDSIPAVGTNGGKFGLLNDEGGSGKYGLLMGMSGVDTGFIQAQRIDGVGTTNSLTIQPNGGNVGIGTINPSAKLSVIMTASSATPPINSILSATQGGISAGSDEGWHKIGAASEPAFQNSWANAGGSDGTMGFRKLPTGLVLIQGVVTGGNSGTTIFTLPVGYRPLNSAWVSGDGGGGTLFHVEINGGNGNVVAQYTGVPLTNQGISGVFFAEQ